MVVVVECEVCGKEAIFEYYCRLSQLDSSIARYKSLFDRYENKE